MDEGFFRGAAEFVSGAGEDDDFELRVGSVERADVIAAGGGGGEAEIHEDEFCLGGFLDDGVTVHFEQEDAELALVGVVFEEEDAGHQSKTTPAMTMLGRA